MVRTSTELHLHPCGEVLKHAGTAGILDENQISRRKAVLLMAPLAGQSLFETVEP